MTYVVTENCIKCKYMDCVEVCPVDCFYEGENPPGAIIPDSDANAEKWLGLNTDYAAKWPNITRKGTAPEDADAFKDEKGKFDKYFSPNPGSGS